MDLKDVVATNLRRIRTARKPTQEELAARAGVSMRYVGMMERDTTSSITVMGKVADALEIEPSELVDRSGFARWGARGRRGVKLDAADSDSRPPRGGAPK